MWEADIKQAHTARYRLQVVLSANQERKQAARTEPKMWDEVRKVSRER